MLGPLCDRTDKRYPFVKHNEDWKKYASLNNSHKNSHRNHTNTTLFFTKTSSYWSINQTLHPTERMPLTFVFCVCGEFCVSGTQDTDNKITDTRKAVWPSFEGAGLVIHTPQVQVPSRALARFALSSPEFKSSAVLVNSQLVCLNLAAGILSRVIFHLNLFVIHYPWKLLRREDNWEFIFILFLLLQIFSLQNTVFFYFSIA